MKIKAGIFALLLLVVNQAHAMRWYSPNTGRFISRDPIEEDGGANLYGFTCNDPISKYDELGLVDNQFKDLGVHPSRPSIIAGKKGLLSGETTLSSFTWNWKISGESTAYKIDLSNAVMKGTYWYATDKDKTHELHHVELWMKGGNLFEEQVKQFTGCLPQVKCYSGLLDEVSKVYLLYAAAWQAEFDCKEYGSVFPGKCSEAQEKRKKAVDAKKAVNTKIIECSKKTQ
ncbi:MAG: RHS repeat-associated core domain-containing protein [Verrucomicrobia bacterium]|nr:RHS repeat-associated core domain-containing protein [Verrucomicrobiota bacterium]